MANQCYLAATKCSGSGPTTVYVLQKMAMGAGRQSFYFQYNGSYYSVNPQGVPVDPPPPVTSIFVRGVTPTFSSCGPLCTVYPLTLCMQPGDIGPVCFTIGGGSNCAGTSYTLSTQSNLVTQVTVNGTVVALPYNGTVGTSGTDNVCVTVSASAVVGDSIDIVVGGSYNETVVIEFGGATCTGTQPTSVSIVDGSGLAAAVSADNFNSTMPTPCTCAVCSLTLPITLNASGSCNYMPNVTGQVSIGGVQAFVNSTTVANMSLSGAPWTIATGIYVGGCGTVGVSLIKPCGSDPTGRYYYQKNNSPGLDYSGWVDVK